MHVALVASVLYGIAMYGLVWYGIVLYDMVWYDVWQRMVRHQVAVDRVELKGARRLVRKRIVLHCMGWRV